MDRTVSGDLTHDAPEFLARFRVKNKHNASSQAIQAALHPFPRATRKTMWHDYKTEHCSLQGRAIRTSQGIFVKRHIDRHAQAGRTAKDQAPITKNNQGPVTKKHPYK